MKKIVHRGWVPVGLTRAGIEFPELLRHNPDFESQYATKLSAINNKQPQKLYPGEFLRYLLLHKDGQKTPEVEAAILKQFEEKIGKSQGFLTDNVFDRGCWLYNQLIDQLALLSNRNLTFWRQSQFNSTDADAITLDLTRDIKYINEYYARSSARLAQRNH